MTEITISESGCPLFDYFAKVNITPSFSIELGIEVDDTGDFVSVCIGEGSDAKDIFSIIDDYFVRQLEVAVARFENDRD